jgi:hypothetical protein
MKEQNFGGQASWFSSNVNLVNTSIFLPTFAELLLTCCSHRRGDTGNANGYEQNGNIVGRFRNIVVWPRSSFRLISTNAMRSILGEGHIFLFCIVPDHISQCSCHIRRCNRYKVLRCRSQLLDHYWGPDARCR